MADVVMADATSEHTLLSSKEMDGEPPAKMPSCEMDRLPANACTSNEKPVSFTLVFGHQKHPVSASLDQPVEEFRKTVQEITGVPIAMQKLMCKGGMKDGVSLREAKVSENCKVMLVGSTLNDVVQVNTKPGPETAAKTEDTKGTSSKEPLCKQKIHAKVIEKGVPEDALPGVKKLQEMLPYEPLSGMRNKYNHKVRLTFKLEVDQLWIGTPERTEKIPMSQIRSIVSESIEGHEQYHVMGIQLGTTEQSRYWIYWVPAQFVSAIKKTVLGP